MGVRDTIVGPKQAKAEPTCIKDPVTDKLLTEHTTTQNCWDDGRKKVANLT